MGLGTRHSSWREVAWAGLWTSIFFGCVGGAVEAGIVALHVRRILTFAELFGYAVLIDAALLGALGGLVTLVVIMVGSRMHSHVSSWLVSHLAPAGWIVVGIVAVFRWRALVDPEHALGPANLAPGLVAFGGSAVILAVLTALSLRPRGARVGWATAFGSRIAPVASLLISVIAIGAITWDIYTRMSEASFSAAPMTPSADARMEATPSAVARAEAPPPVAPTSPSGVARAEAPPRAAQQRPNVLLVTIDSLRADRIDPLSPRRASIPTLDKLMAEGAYFSRTYSTRNGTTPAHAGLLTGTYPSVNGLRTHMLDLLSPDVPTLAEVLQARGYRTAGFFSWLAFEPPYSGLQRGFDTYTDLTVNLPDYLANPRSGTLAATYKRLKTLLSVPAILDRQFAASADVEDVLDGKADVTTDAVTTWLQDYAHGADANRPFFLWVHYWDPHYPYTPPPAFAPPPDPACQDCPDGSMSTVRMLQEGGVLTEPQIRHLTAYYDGEVSFTDNELGRVLGAMTELGLSDNTLIVVTGDHGESFGEIGRWLHSGDLFHTEIHVPLIVNLPGVIPSGQYVSSVTSSIDVFPTILDVLQFPLTAPVNGESLAPIFRDSSYLPRTSAFSELNDRRVVSIVDERWQLLLDNITGQARLYRADDETLDDHNHAAVERDVVRDLSRRIEKWMEAYP